MHLPVIFDLSKIHRLVASQIEYKIERKSSNSSEAHESFIKMLKINKIFTIFILLKLVEPKIFLIVDEKYEDCTQGGTSGIFDYSQMKFIVKNDNVYLNGMVFILTLIVLKILFLQAN